MGNPEPFLPLIIEILDGAAAARSLGLGYAGPLGPVYQAQHCQFLFHCRPQSFHLFPELRWILFDEVFLEFSGSLDRPGVPRLLADLTAGALTTAFLYGFIFGPLLIFTGGFLSFVYSS